MVTLITTENLEKLFIAFVGAIFAIVVAEVVRLIKTCIKEVSVKNLLKTDLEHKQLLLKQVIEEYLVLREYVIKGSDGSIKIKAFEELTMDIFKANSLNDYFKIFRSEEFIILIEIYQIFDFLIEYKPSSLHESHVSKIDKNAQYIHNLYRDDLLKNDDKILEIIRTISTMTLENIDNNLETIRVLKEKMTQLAPALGSKKLLNLD